MRRDISISVELFRLRLMNGRSSNLKDDSEVDRETETTS